MTAKFWGNPPERRNSRRVPWAPPILMVENEPKPKAAGEIRRERLLATQRIPEGITKGTDLHGYALVETWTERKARRARERAGIPEYRPNRDSSKRRKPLSQSRRNKMRRAARRKQRQIEAMRALKPKRRRA